MHSNAGYYYYRPDKESETLHEDRSAVTESKQVMAERAQLNPLNATTPDGENPEQDTLDYADGSDERSLGAGEGTKPRKTPLETVAPTTQVSSAVI